MAEVQALRWFGRFLIVLLLLAAVLAPALWLGRDTIPPRLAQWAINNALQTDAIDALAFRVRRIGLDGLSLVDIRINRDAPATIDRLDVGYRWRALLTGRVDEVVVVGAVLTARVDARGTVTLGSLEKLRTALQNRDAERQQAHAPALPGIRLVGGLIRVTGAADGTVNLAGPVTFGPGGFGANLDVATELRRSDGDRLTADGRVVFDGGGDGNWVIATLDTADVVLGRLSLTGLRGTASISQSPEGNLVGVVDLYAREAQAAGAAMPLPAVFARLDRHGASGIVRLGPEEAPEAMLAVAIDPRDGGTGNRFRAEGRADLARLDTALAAIIDRAPVGMAGSAELRLGGAVRAGLVDGDAEKRANAWRAAILSGGIDLRLEALPLPDPVGGMATGEGRVGIAVAAGRMVAETAGPFRLETEGGGASDPVKTIFGDTPVAVTLGTDTRPVSLLLTPGKEKTTLTLTGPATARASNGARLSVDGEALLEAADEGWRLAAGTELAVRARDLQLGDLQVDRGLLTVTDLRTGEEGISAVWALAADGAAPEIGAETVALSLAGRMTRSAERTVVAVVEPGRLDLRRFRPSEILAPMDAVSVALGGSKRPVLVVPAKAEPIELRFPLTVSALKLGDRAGTWAAAIDPAKAAFEARIDRAGNGSARLRMRNGRAEGVDTGIALDGLSTDLRLAVSAWRPSLDRLDFAAGKLSDRRRLPWFVPLTINGSARRVAEDGIGFLATARGANGALVVDLAGQARMDRGTALASFKVFPIDFVPDGLQPADLVPAAAALFRDTSGRIAVDGTVTWPGAPRPGADPLTVSVSDLSFTGSLGAVSGLTGEIALAGIDPVQTEPGQTLVATAIDLGVPIAQPSARFQVTGGDTLWVDRIEARFAGGTVLAEDVVVPLSGEGEVAVTLDVTAVDAAGLAEVVDLEGLQATGSLSGQLPVVWDPRAGLSVRAARLATTGGGTLRYAPATPPPALQDAGPEVSLMLQAIRNLVYERLELEADGRPGEPFDIKLRVRGANPDLYDGHPVALNVTLTGRLDELFRSARRSLGLGDALRRQIQANGLGG